MAFTPDVHFRTFSVTLEREIAKYGEPVDVSAQQKDQMGRLLAMEEAFRLALIASPFGTEVYEGFITMIRDTRRQILDARPFFRARSKHFTAAISPALKARDAKALSTFPPNYEFVAFVVQFRTWAKNSKVKKLADQITKLREEICVLLLPLSINRARVFFKATEASRHRSHLEYMDLLQIAAKGLLNGIDKYSPGDGEVVPRTFRGTAIGRMGGSLISNSSETLLHFFPLDARKLYRANKAVSHQLIESVDLEEVADKVNDGLNTNLKTNSIEISEILAAASCVSADTVSTVADAEGSDQISQYAAPDSCRPDVQAEENDVRHRVSMALSQLTIFERKVLQLKGVNLGTFAINIAS